MTRELVQMAERTGYLDRFHSLALTNDGMLMLYFINKHAGERAHTSVNTHTMHRHDCREQCRVQDV